MNILKLPRLLKRRPRRANQFRQTATRFGSEESGVAAIEFALVAPILVILLLGTAGVTNAIWAKSKTTHATGIIGDLVSQADVIPLNGANSMTDILSAAPDLMSPFGGDQSLEVTVTQAIACSNDPSNPTAAVDYLVIWSQRWTEDAGVADGYGFQSALPNSPNDLRIPHDDFLLVTEIIYQHKPPVSLTDQSVYDFKETSFNQPRAAGNVTFTPAGNDNDTTCSMLGY